MGNRLDIDTFNEILFGAFADQSPKAKAELYLHELSFAMGSKIEAMEKVIDKLNNNLPYHKELETVNAIDKSCDKLKTDLDNWMNAHPEIKKEFEEETGYVSEQKND